LGLDLKQLSVIDKVSIYITLEPYNWRRRGPTIKAKITPVLIGSLSFEEVILYKDVCMDSNPARNESDRTYT